MRAQLIRIGNSRGIRIPKSLIEQCGFGEIVELRADNDRLIISQRRPRQNWSETFRAAGSAAHDELLLGEESNVFDREEWQW